MNYITERAVS